MTGEDLAELSARVKVLAAERHQAVLRREELLAERDRLFDDQLAIRDLMELNVLLGNTVRIGANGALRRRGPNGRSSAAAGRNGLALVNGASTDGASRPYAPARPDSRDLPGVGAERAPQSGEQSAQAREPLAS
jgi:hypothetical protein